MKKILKINSSKYSIEYEENKEWDYCVKRCGEDAGSDLKTNLVFDMFQMILELQKENKKLKNKIINTKHTNVLFSEDGKCLMRYTSDNDTVYVVPEGIEEIGPLAFHDGKKLESIQLPNSVKYIKYNAVACCYNLTSITLPDNLEELGFSAFEYCSNLSLVIYKGKEYRSKYVLEKALKENGVLVGFSVFENTGMK